MGTQQADFVSKFKWSLPWLVRYPLWRARKLMEAGENPNGLMHVVFVVANHFEPGVGKQAVAPVERWCKLATRTGLSLQDQDGTNFRHTYFFPAEQYDYASIEKLCALQAEGLGEIEVHLHHGVDKPDNAENTRYALESFRDTLAYKHDCLSHENPAAHRVTLSFTAT